MVGPAYAESEAMSLSVKVNSLITLKADRVKKQVRFAASLAINDVARVVQGAEQRLIGATFAHPRPFTVNSVALGPLAKPDRLVRSVFIKDKTASYLEAYEHGGEHFIPNRPDLGRVLLEPVHAPVDAYGQMRKGTIERLLARPDVFVGTVHEILGVWQRAAQSRGQRRSGSSGVKGLLLPALNGGRTSLILLAKVIPNRPVHEHLGFVEQGHDLVEYLWPDAMRRALVRALATAK